ncbi:MAG: Uma2 family endonuclease [Gemmatimonadales bacterium]|nr:Uma2 family endonuclease [Gemmatimonadales bacterium]
MPVRVPTYTVDDLEAFPSDGNRYELLDGVLLVTPSPSFGHQLIGSRLAVLLSRYLDPFNRAIVIGPGAVEHRPLTHLEPDVLVISKGHRRNTKWNDIRDWWLAVEVMSRSSRRYDRDFKRDAYLALGVPEVWLIDPREEEVLVSRQAGPKDRRCRGKLLWTPPGMPAPLELDLAALFADG